MRLARLAVAFALVACTIDPASVATQAPPPSSSSTHTPNSPSSPPRASATPSSPPIASSDAGADARTVNPLTVVSIAPLTVARDGGPITITGTGFLDVQDVSVQLMGVPFVVVDDSTIELTAPSLADVEGLAYPAAVPVVVTRAQAKPAGGSVTYE